MDFFCRCQNFSQIIVDQSWIKCRIPFVEFLCSLDSVQTSRTCGKQGFQILFTINAHDKQCAEVPCTLDQVHTCPVCDKQGSCSASYNDLFTNAQRATSKAQSAIDSVHTHTHVSNRVLCTIDSVHTSITYKKQGSVHLRLCSHRHNHWRRFCAPYSQPIMDQGYECYSNTTTRGSRESFELIFNGISKRAMAGSEGTCGVSSSMQVSTDYAEKGG